MNNSNMINGEIMINKTLSDKLLLFLQEYLSFYKEFLQLETEKYNDMTQNNIGLLDERVKTEQAFMLKSKGLELERERLWAQAGSPNSTLQESIPLFDSSVQGQLKEIYKELLQVLFDLKETNLRCNYLTELKLHKVEVDLQKLKNHPELEERYDSKAKSHPASGVLSKMV